MEFKYLGAEYASPKVNLSNYLHPPDPLKFQIRVYNKNLQKAGFGGLRYGRIM